MLTARSGDGARSKSLEWSTERATDRWSGGGVRRESLVERSSTERAPTNPRGNGRQPHAARETKDGLPTERHEVPSWDSLKPRVRGFVAHGEEERRR